MIFRLFSKAWFMLILAGCAAQAPTTNSAKVERTERTMIAAPMPDWLVNRPQSDVYYMGIGNASMQDADYMQTAKKEALNDLASEISITISSRSILYQLDVDTKFTEEYRSAIAAHVDQHIEGYELQDSWSDENLYWVCYRLSKSEYRRRIDEKKSTALQKGLDFYLKAVAAADNRDYATAINYYLQTLESVNSYLAEDTEVTYNSKKILLASEAYYRLQDLLGGIDFKGPEKIQLKRGELQGHVVISAIFRDSTGSYPVRNLPVIIADPSDGSRRSTGTGGEVRIGPDLIRASSVSITLDLPVYLQSLSPVIRTLAGSLRVPRKDFIVEIKPVTVYVISEEKNLGKPLDTPILKSILMAGLAGNSIVMSDDSRESDMIIKLNSDTRRGPETSGLHTSYLDVQLQVMQASTKKVFYATSVRDIKGIQLSYEKAGLAAYGGSREAIEESLVASVLKEVFKLD